MMSALVLGTTMMEGGVGVNGATAGVSPTIGTIVAEIVIIAVAVVLEAPEDEVTIAEEAAVAAPVAIDGCINVAIAIIVAAEGEG